MTDENRPIHHGNLQFPTDHNDALLRVLHNIIGVATRFLAVLMAIVIVWGTLDVVYTIYQNVLSPPYFLIGDIVKSFGAFLSVLIAFEIFTNITLYIRRDVIPIKLVVATALMAISRKVIVLDYETVENWELAGVALIILALGLTYWLLTFKTSDGGQVE